MAVLRDREYVKVDKKRLIPEDKGRLVTAFLESFFTRYVGYDFTADLEEKLDKVSNSEISVESNSGTSGSGRLSRGRLLRILSRI